MEIRVQNMIMFSYDYRRWYANDMLCKRRMQNKL